MHNLSNENEFYLHVNENWISHQRLCTATRFEKEVQDNLEMAYALSFGQTRNAREGFLKSPKNSSKPEGNLWVV